MKEKVTKLRFLKAPIILNVCVMVLIFLSILLLWHGNATSNQAVPALVADVYFDGEYRIEDGDWQKIVSGKHISSTEGDVTLRGNFHMVAPDGEYVGIYSGDMPIAFFTDHINLTFYQKGEDPFVIDMENPIYGTSACGVDWTAFAISSEEPVEILIHNPHKFGNETAIDKLLSNIAFWSGLDFEKGVLEVGQSQRNIGLLLIIVSLLFLGTALFSALIHIKNSKIIWLLGIIILFAGLYFSYSAEGVSFWSKSIVSNTTMLGCSMMFYMLFITMALVILLKSTKTVGIITVIALGVIIALTLILPIITDILFYDTWLYWAALQILANIILLGCLIKEFFVSKEKKRPFYLCATLPLLSFVIDVLLIDLGIWSSGVSSKYVFIVFVIVALVMVLKIIPNNINTLAKAKELEMEKKVLNAELAESRISTMMSQIRPHFIYNTLGSIEQLCEVDPPKAGELVHNFAKYLRGNFGELDNPKPILMSQEMEHVRHYINIENVRFPDMTFSFEMNSEDFCLPALTVQPIVENAIKHGLMKLQKGGSIRVVSYETQTDYCISVEDDGVGFDTDKLFNDKNHIGIRNIRDRLKVMVGGSLEITSVVGVGTKVLITIPKGDIK
jgi:signal transduction histidine kinase